MMKKCLICFLFLFLVLCNKIVISSDSAYFELAYYTLLDYEDADIDFFEVVEDFSNNEYLYIHLVDGGHAVIDICTEMLTELDYDTDFLLNCEGEKFYGGPFIVYSYDGSNYINCIDGEIIDYEEIEELRRISVVLHDALVNYQEEYDEFSMLSTQSVNDTGDYIVENGEFLIKDYKYFDNLKIMPKNTDGECGFVSLATYMGYLDTFYDCHLIETRDFISNIDEFFENGNNPEGKYYVNYDECYANENLFGNVSVPTDDNNADSNNEILMKNNMYIYKVEKDFGAEKTYDSFSLDDFDLLPGVKNPLKNCLRNYGHHFFSDDPNADKHLTPSTCGQLFDTFVDYINDKKGQYYRARYNLNFHFLFNSLWIKSDIRSGLPSIATLLSFILEDYDGFNDDSSGDKVKYHDLIIYGYKDNMFRCQFGWYKYDDSETGEKLKISRGYIVDAWILSSLSIEYVGIHEHCENIKWYANGHSGFYCPCGEVICNHEDSQYIEEQTNLLRHTYYCDYCDRTWTQEHEFETNPDGTHECTICHYLIQNCPHVYRYSSGYTRNYHNVKCSICENTSIETHHFENFRGEFVCRDCGYTTENPVINNREVKE